MDTTEKKKNNPVADDFSGAVGSSDAKKSEGKKIDPRKLVIYSEIMKPKFDE